MPVQPPAPKLFGSAQHHQARAHLLSVPRQHFDLGFAEIFPRHVGQKHGVERLQFRQRSKQLIARPHRHLQIFFPQLVDQKIELARDPLKIFDQQHLPLAAHVRERGGPVVRRDRVLRRIVGHKPGFIGVKIGRVDFFAHD